MHMIPIIKIRPSWDREMFIMGIPVLVGRHLDIETAWFDIATSSPGNTLWCNEKYMKYIRYQKLLSVWKLHVQNDSCIYQWSMSYKRVFHVWPFSYYRWEMIWWSVLRSSRGRLLRQPEFRCWQCDIWLHIINSKYPNIDNRGNIFVVCLERTGGNVLL